MLGRDVTSIMRLLPGVRYENTVDSLGMSFGTAVPNVGGARRDWSNVIVDGVVANEVGASSLMAQQINLDAIAEVRVLLNSYRAEYGRAGGGQVQIVSKSGSSNYHGNLYYYGRNEALNATNFFINRANASRSRATASTPTAPTSAARCRSSSKKLFFFYSIEAPLVSRPGPLRNWTMPTDREMQGDFSQTLDCAGPADQHQGSAARGRVQRRHRRAGMLPRQHHPRQPHQLERPRAAQHAAARQQLRPAFTQGQFNYSTQENAENPKMNNVVRVDWRPSCERQLLLHVQGLVLGPARQRDHRRAEQVGLLQHPLPEHRPRRQRELREDHPARTWSSTPTSAPGSRPSSSIR